LSSGGKEKEKKETKTTKQKAREQNTDESEHKDNAGHGFDEGRKPFPT
jgi:hypothetical protein